MYKTIFMCDGCGVKMNETEHQSSILAAQRFVQDNPQAVCRVKVFDIGPVQFNAVTEIFCPVCLTGAPEYWTSKIPAIEDMIKEVNTRFIRQREEFFRKRKAKLKAVI